MPRNNSKRKKLSFIDDEPELSGDEAAHRDDMEEVDLEPTAEDLAFLDDDVSATKFIPSAPPPLFIEQYNEANSVQIEEVVEALPDPVKPPTKPDPPKAVAPAHHKTKLTSFFKASGKPAAKPPAGVTATPIVTAPTAPPPPPPPDGDSAVKMRRPKARAPKRLTALIQSHLAPAADVGTLLFNLVTVIPDIERSIEDSWKNIQSDYALVAEQVRLLPGLFGAFICVETHGGTNMKPKKDDDKSKKKPKSTVQSELELDFFETDDGALLGTDPVQYMTAGRGNKLTGKAHLHVLCYSTEYHQPRLDTSLLKRRLLQLFPNGDVHDKGLPERCRSRTPHYVRTAAYVFKGIECPATLENWHKYIDKDATPPLPEFIEGKDFWERTTAQSIALTERWTAFLREIPSWCTFTTDTTRGKDSAFTVAPGRPTEEYKAMTFFSEVMRAQRIAVSPSAERNGERFYELEKRDDYVVQRTFAPGYGIYDLVKRLQKLCDRRVDQILLNYKAQIPLWCHFSTMFHTLERKSYAWIELKDGYYNIHENIYRTKHELETFDATCFRAYPYTVQELRDGTPQNWLALVEHICERNVVAVIPPPKRDKQDVRDFFQPPEGPREIIHQVDKHRLLLDLAGLLRRRKPKQPVPFLLGGANTGKTTVSSFLTQLYPYEALGFLNDSTAPLSGVNEDIVALYCDEFYTGMIPREDLLLLLDGSQPLTIRKLHNDARIIKNPLMPIILLSNFKPEYHKDDSAALDARLSFHTLTRPLKVELNKFDLIAKEHLFIVRYLNEYYQKNETLH